MLELIQRFSKTRYRPAAGRVGAMAISVAVLTGLAGCAPMGGEKALDEVARSIRSADTHLTGLSVESGRDGFASVLSVSVAIKEDTVDVARLSSLLSAVLDAPGASDFTLLRFGVRTPSLNGKLVDLRPSAKQLGVTALDATISGDITSLKKAAGGRYDARRAVHGQIRAREQP